MDWKLHDAQGALLKRVNCEYDACDISRWEFGAKKIHLDFSKKEAHIIEEDIETEGGDRD